MALALAPFVIFEVNRTLRAHGRVTSNYRGRSVVSFGGVAIAISAVVTLVASVVFQQFSQSSLLPPGTDRVVVFLGTVALVGLVDDLYGGAPKGIRGHWRALSQGRLSTGAIKALGVSAGALYFASGRGLGFGEYIVEVLLLVATTNLFNLFDLRPGRALKIFVAAFTIISVASRDVAAIQPLGVAAAPALVFAWFDLRERAMLGDVGSNLVGALVGLLMVSALSTVGQLAAMAAVVGLTVYAECCSLTALIERRPLLRRLDSLGQR